MKNAKRKTAEKKEAIHEKKYWYLLAGLLVFTFLIYLQSLNNEYVKWDDDWFVYENPAVNNLANTNFSELLSEFYSGQYSPLTAIVMGMQYTIGGGTAYGFHLFSLIFHLISTFLVYLIAKRLLNKPFAALITAALFALHPMQVECVSWISAQKVINYTLLFLLALHQYIKYIDKGYQIKYLLFSFIFFSLSFLAKEQAVTFAITILGIDYLKNRNLLDKKVIFEKIPFLITALIMGYITIQSSKSGEFFTEDKNFPFYQQIAYSSYAFMLYLFKMVFPIQLSAFYPYPTENYSEFPVYIYAFILPVAAIIFYFFKLFKRNKLFVFGVFFFVANIILVLQLMPLRDFIIADRYIYIPAIGLFMWMAFYLDKWAERKSNRNLIYSILGILFISYGVMSLNRSQVWANSYDLFTDVVEKYPESSVGWNNRGLAQANLDRHTQAIEDYRLALKYNPNSLFVYNNLGISLTKMGRNDDAIKYLSAALEVDPDFAQALFNRADSKGKIGDLTGSNEDYTQFIKLRPDYSKAYISRGINYFKLKEIELALTDLDQAIEIDPHAEAYLNRGVVYLNTKQYELAIIDFTETLKYRPNFNYAYFNRGLAFISSGNQQAGCNDLSKAASLGFTQAQSALQQYCK